ncbi:MAG: hypothetical protein AAGA59_03675 [Actinomycetota bacterium]
MVNDTPNPRPEPHHTGASDVPSTPQPPTDEVLDRLRAARPVDHNPLPRPDGPQANAFLESIMSANPAAEPGGSPTPPPTGETGDDRRLDPVLFADDAEHDYARPTVISDRRRRRGGYGMILATAAAVAVLVAGALALLPANTEPALAAVQSAAQATAEAQSGRVDVTVDLDAADDIGTGMVEASVNGRFNGPDVAFTIGAFDVSEDGATEDLIGELPLSETRFVDGVLYADVDGEGWIGVEAPEFVGAAVTDLADPREVLTAVEDLVEATEVGPATLTEPDGATVETTQYRSVVDLGDESLSQSGWLAGLELSDIEAEGEITVDLYVDGEGWLRQLSVSGDLTEPEGGPGEARFEVVTSFYDIGGDITIEAPEGVEVMEADDLLGEGFEADFEAEFDEEFDLDTEDLDE